MEEVDGIIIHSLKSVGCDIEEDVLSLHQFSTDLIVEATARFIKAIKNDIELPHKLPPGMSARFRIGTSLAEAVKEIGFRGEVGYQTFLYSNENDIRRMFMFLVEKLPKAGAEVAEESMGGSEMLHRSIAHEIARRLNSPWTPPYCKIKGIAWRGSPPKWQREDTSSVHTYHADHLTTPEGLHDLTKKIPKEKKSYYTHHLPLVSNQPRHHHNVAPSVIESNAISFTAQQEWETEWNQQGLASRLSPEEYKARKRQRLQKKLQEQLQQGVAAGAAAGASQDLNALIASISDRAASAGKTKGSRFTHTEKLQFAPDEDRAAAQMGVGEGPRVDTEEEMQKKRQEEVEGLRDELQQLSSKLESLEIDIKKMSASKQQIEEEMKNIKTRNSEKEDTYKVKKKTLDLLPDAENNIAKLQSMVDASAQRVVNLANQWEKHRAPLIQQYRELKEVSEDRASEAQTKLEEIKELRERMKEVASEAKGKEELYKQLVSEFERMTKDVNRSAYTRKIMEIVANIKKQKQEIDKVLIDTRAIQKEINQLSGKLDRTFTVTDELIFRDAKKDEAVRKAYKHLAALHENFNGLIKTVEETGVIMREIRDLEDQIEIESNKKIVSNLEKISDDYQEMKKENAGLISKLKKQ